MGWGGAAGAGVSGIVWGCQSSQHPQHAPAWSSACPWRLTPSPCVSALGPTRPVTLFTFVVLLSCIIFSFFGLCLKKLQPRKPSSYQVSVGSPSLLPPCAPSLPWGVFAVRDLGVWLHPDQTKGSGTHTAAPHPWMHQRWVVPWLGMQAAFLACLVKSWFGWD